MQQKTKKLTSLILLFSLLISMFTLLSVAADTATAPTNDTEAIAAGYHAKYVEGGVTKYIKFAAKSSAVSGDNRNSELSVVPAGGTVTLLTDVTIGFELVLQGNYTIDGNGKTITGGFRTADGATGANITIKNATLKTSDENFGTINSYLYQINSGNPNNECTFENCTIIINGTPAYGAFVIGGILNMVDCDVTYTTTDEKGSGNNPNALVWNSSGKLNLENTSITINGPANLYSAAAVLGTVGAGCSFKLKDNVEFTVPGAADITNTADWAMPNEGITPAGGKEGFRVGTVVSKSWWDANKGVTVKEWGTMIDVASQVKDGDKFSLTMLKASDNKYATVANDGWFREDANADTLCFYGVLTGIAPEKANTEFGGIGYITLTVPGLGEFTYYGNGAFFQNSAE